LSNRACRSSGCSGGCDVVSGGSGCSCNSIPGSCRVDEACQSACGCGLGLVDGACRSGDCDCTTWRGRIDEACHIACRCGLGLVYGASICGGCDRTSRRCGIDVTCQSTGRRCLVNCACLAICCDCGPRFGSVDGGEVRLGLGACWSSCVNRGVAILRCCTWRSSSVNSGVVILRRCTCLHHRGVLSYSGARCCRSLCDCVIIAFSCKDCCGRCRRRFGDSEVVALGTVLVLSRCRGLDHG